MTSNRRLVAFALAPTLAFAIAAQAGASPAAPTAPAKATATAAQPAAPAAPAKTAATAVQPAAAAKTTATPAQTAPSTTVATPYDAVIAGAWRDLKNVARDKYRHPKETLAFFGVKPDQMLIEISPGGGWYTEILAPLERDHGHYAAAVSNPATAKDPRRQAEYQRDINLLNTKHDAHPEVYDKAEMRKIDTPSTPVFGPPGSADVVLTFRNVHNWVGAGTQAAMFKAFFDVLKPGGVLGVTDHRAKPGPATDGRSGYVTEQQVIDYATAAGFVLDGKSEINANPNDTKDYPHGVWTLPPTLSQGDHNLGSYLKIGESDRMTLRFSRPRVEAKK